MKNKLCFLTAGLLLINTTAAFAGTTDVPASYGSAATGDAISTSSAVTVSTGSAVAVKAPIKLSLKDAIKIMQTTGTRAETAELNKKSDQAIAAGYGETVSTISETLRNIQFYNANAPAALANAYSQGAQDGGATKSNRKILRIRRDFAKAQVEPNYKAEMNQIEYDTLKVYYSVLLAADNVKTEQDNLKAQGDILKNTKAQYQVGMLAKKDVLSAQSAETAAKSSLRAAQTKLEYAKMSFNFLLGYAATQEVILTDSLNEMQTSAIDVDAAIKSAAANRNEIKGANYAVDVHRAVLDGLESRYPKNSSTYIKEQVAVLAAEKTLKDAPVQIEIDIRNKAAELEDKKAALDAAKAMQTYAKEGYRLISISYDAGMSTLAELQQAQVNVYKAGLAVSAATSDYDLAVYAFRYAQDVGVQRLPL